jgi:anti-anti-sigma factor
MTDSEQDAGAEHPGVSVTIHRHGDDAAVTVRGEIDLESSAELGTALAGLEGPGEVTLDLSDVSYMDSTGLRTLLKARDAVVAAGGRLRVGATSSIVARLIEITGASELFED